MYAQIFFVTSVRGAVFTPHTAAKASESFFGAKMPTPFFFMAAAVLPRAFFVALSVAFVAFVMVGFFVAVVLTVVFFAVVVVVIAIEGC